MDFCRTRVMCQDISQKEIYKFNNGSSPNPLNSLNLYNPPNPSRISLYRTGTARLGSSPPSCRFRAPSPTRPGPHCWPPLPTRRKERTQKETTNQCEISSFNVHPFISLHVFLSLYPPVHQSFILF